MAFHRATLTLNWHVRPDPVPGAWHDWADFFRHAVIHLLGTFRHYNATLELEHVVERGDEVVIEMTLGVDLDAVPGAFHQPEDHASYAVAWLHDNVQPYSQQLSISTTVAPLPMAA